MFCALLLLVKFLDHFVDYFVDYIMNHSVDHFVFSFVSCVVCRAPLAEKSENQVQYLFIYLGSENHSVPDRCLQLKNQMIFRYGIAKNLWGLIIEVGHKRVIVQNILFLQ